MLSSISELLRNNTCGRMRENFDYVTGEIVSLFLSLLENNFIDYAFARGKKCALCKRSLFVIIINREFWPSIILFFHESRLLSRAFAFIYITRVKEKYCMTVPTCKIKCDIRGGAFTIPNFLTCRLFIVPRLILRTSAWQLWIAN